MVEAEFGSVLQQADRAGNILSTTMRNAWDGKALRVMSRSNKDSCKEPHMALIGNVTLEELRLRLSLSDQSNGFGNRILWVGARRSKELAHGGQVLDPGKLEKLVGRLQTALFTAKQTDQIRWDDAAAVAWTSAYHELVDGSQGVYGRMTARAAPLVARLASIFALLDCSDRIRSQHLEAAMEVWAYCDDSVLHFFGDSIGNETANAILRKLRASSGGLTRSQLSLALGNHKGKELLNQALAALKRAGRITSESVQTGGRPAELWKVLAK